MKNCKYYYSDATISDSFVSGKKAIGIVTDNIVVSIYDWVGNKTEVSYYNFSKDGISSWHMPSYSNIKEIYNNKSYVNECMSKISATQLSETWYWTRGCAGCGTDEFHMSTQATNLDRSDLSLHIRPIMTISEAQNAKKTVPNCSTYDTARNCTACIYGFRLSSGQCLACQYCSGKGISSVSYINSSCSSGYTLDYVTKDTCEGYAYCVYCKYSGSSGGGSSSGCTSQQRMNCQSAVSSCNSISDSWQRNNCQQQTRSQYGNCC